MRHPARAFLSLPFLVLALPGAAQEVPRIRDVYASARAEPGLGPTTDSREILARADTLLGGAKAVQYDVHVATGDARAGAAVEFWGSVVLDAGAPAAPRYRITLNGHDRDSVSRTVVLAATGESFVLLDMSARTVTENATLSAFGGLAWLVPHVVVPDLGARTGSSPEGLEFLGVQDVRGHPCYSVHFADPVRNEHAYVFASTRDGMPRRLERVGMDPSGRPRTVTVDVIDPVLDPPLTGDPFRIAAPTGFRRLGAPD